LPSLLGDAVVSGLAPMTAAGFLKDLSQDLVRDVRHHVLGPDVQRLRVIVDGDLDLTPVAYIAAGQFENSAHAAIYHLGGIIVDTLYQHQGIGRLVLLDEIYRIGADYLAFHTQNRHMLTLGEALSEYDFSLSLSLAPDMGTLKPSIKTLDDVTRVVHEGRYNHASLYGDLAVLESQGSMIKDLNTTDGDALVYVGRVL
jgi:hypothetical protein